MAPKFALFTKGSKLPLNKGFKNIFEFLQSCDQDLNFVYILSSGTFKTAILALAEGEKNYSRNYFVINFPNFLVQITNSKAKSPVHLGFEHSQHTNTRQDSIWQDHHSLIHFCSALDKALFLP